MGRAGGQLVLEPFHGACEGVQVFDAAFAAHFLHLREQLIAHSIAGEARAAVARVLAPLQACTAQSMTDFLAAHREQRPQDGHLPGGAPGGPRVSIRTGAGLRPARSRAA